jgi:hypothetical protein
LFDSPDGLGGFSFLASADAVGLLGAATTQLDIGAHDGVDSVTFKRIDEASAPYKVIISTSTSADILGTWQEIGTGDLTQPFRVPQGGGMLSRSLTARPQVISNGEPITFRARMQSNGYYTFQCMDTGKYMRHASLIIYLDPLVVGNLDFGWKPELEPSGDYSILAYYGTNQRIRLETSQYILRGASQNTDFKFTPPDSPSLYQSFDHFVNSETLTITVPRTTRRYWQFAFEALRGPIRLREIFMRSSVAPPPVGVQLIEAYTSIQPRSTPVMLLDGATSGTLTNSPDGTLHHTYQITTGGECRATPGDLIVNHVMGGLSDLRLLVDGEGTHGFTATMGFDAGTDLPPPAPSRANVFVDTASNTFAGAMPHHTGSVVEPYAVRAVPSGPRFADPLVIYRATSFTGMSMDVQSQSLPIDAPPPGASVEELAAAWAKTLLRAHYLTGLPPADAEASVVSNVASGDPLVLELTMPSAGNVINYEQSISHQVALALGGRVLGRYPDGLATVYVQDLGDDASPYEAEALFDGCGDPFGGNAYILNEQNGFMEVVVPMPNGGSIDHLRMYPSPGFRSQSPRGILLTAARG